ncbi:hypothetical protein ACLIKD_06775 [Azonexus sp. IMCC34842]|uniref:hypothetical protein n=1 Tax=Azonexus sp. IMCC34842 TaxID=3420950 RepID=UPI003D14802A
MNWEKVAGEYTCVNCCSWEGEAPEALPCHVTQEEHDRAEGEVKVLIKQGAQKLLDLYRAFPGERRVLIAETRAVSAMLCCDVQSASINVMVASHLLAAQMADTRPPTRPKTKAKPKAVGSRNLTLVSTRNAK